MLLFTHPSMLDHGVPPGHPERRQRLEAVLAALDAFPLVRREAPWAARSAIERVHQFMFDEPTAGMNSAEAPVILNLIRELKKDKSKTILLVEHKMDVVRDLADRIIVLHNGSLVADGEPADVIASPVVQEAYLGVAPASGVSA